MIKGLVLFLLFMTGLLTTATATFIIVTNIHVNYMFLIWFAILFGVINGGSWYMLGVKINQYDHEEGNA